MFHGITKRWMLNTLSVIFTIIVLIVVSLIFVVTYVFQNSVEQSLNSACNELSLRATPPTARPNSPHSPAITSRTSIRRNAWA